MTRIRYFHAVDYIDDEKMNLINVKVCWWCVFLFFGFVLFVLISGNECKNVRSKKFLMNYLVDSIASQIIR